ncbi:unnamed protein product [Ceratitis capitata]|uniref:(Mediterranean fruit fly) hypothetical protein n=1 Tax=Ceratitis capitata TaxID=7213 RepID=A0A811TZM2_CERCA|nr:unnamed protein product [Ceratitis capitata]
MIIIKPKTPSERSQSKSEPCSKSKMPGGSGGGNGYEEVAAARRGRFHVTSTAAQGPPETTFGRFRLMPTSNYGAISPILHRGRFAVIPEEPQGSPAQGTPPAGGALRSPSPEWDFDIEQVSAAHTIYVCRGV